MQKVVMKNTENINISSFDSIYYTMKDATIEKEKPLNAKKCVVLCESNISASEVIKDLNLHGMGYEVDWIICKQIEDLEEEKKYLVAIICMKKAFQKKRWKIGKILKREENNNYGISVLSIVNFSFEKVLELKKEIGVESFGINKKSSQSVRIIRKFLQKYLYLIFLCRKEFIKK